MAFNLKAIYRNLSLIIIVVILVVIGLGFYFLKPQYDKLRQTQDSVTAEKNNLETQKQNLKNATDLLKNYEAVKDNLANLSLALPLREDIPNLLVQLESLATKNGVLMSSVSYSSESEEKGTEKTKGPAVKGSSLKPEIPEEEEGVTPAGETPETPSVGYSTLKIDLSLAAHYDAFMKYIEDVQRSLRFLDITSISFDVESQSSTGGTKSGEEEKELDFTEKTFDFSVTLRTYYLNK